VKLIPTPPFPTPDQGAREPRGTDPLSGALIELRAARLKQRLSDLECEIVSVRQQIEQARKLVRRNRLSLVSDLSPNLDAEARGQ